MNDIFRFQRRHKSHRTEIDTEKRNGAGIQFPNNIEYRAVPAYHDSKCNRLINIPQFLNVQIRRQHLITGICKNRAYNCRVSGIGKK